LRDIGVRSLAKKKRLARIGGKRRPAWSKGDSSREFASLASTGSNPKTPPHEDCRETPAEQAYLRFLMSLMRLMRIQKPPEIARQRAKYRANPSL
jgi:hypothetical protein